MRHHHTPNHCTVTARCIGMVHRHGASAWCIGMVHRHGASAWCLVIACLLAFAVFRVEGQTKVHWFKPNPWNRTGGDGNSKATAQYFKESELHTLLTTYSVTDLTILFLGEINDIPPGGTVPVHVPGEYLISNVNGQQFIPLYAGSVAPGTTLVPSRAISLVGVIDSTLTGNRPVLRMRPLLTDPFSTWTSSMRVRHLIASPHESADPSSRVHYLKKFVLRNLDLDGSFTQEGAWTSEANATGYISYALSVAAESGHISNVRVRNFGSVGRVPDSSLHIAAGTERLFENSESERD